MFVRGDERIKGVNESFVANAIAPFRRQSRRLAIAAVVPLPVAVESWVPIGLAVLESGLLAKVQVADAQRGLFWHIAGPRRPPTHPALLLEEAAHGVERAARPATGEEQVWAFRFDHQFF